MKVDAVALGPSRTGVTKSIGDMLDTFAGGPLENPNELLMRLPHDGLPREKAEPTSQEHPRRQMPAAPALSDRDRFDRGQRWTTEVRGITDEPSPGEAIADTSTNTRSARTWPRATENYIPRWPGWYLAYQKRGRNNSKAELEPRGQGPSSTSSS